MFRIIRGGAWTFRPDVFSDREERGYRRYRVLWDYKGFEDFASGRKVLHIRGVSIETAQPTPHIHCMIF